jgi:hypothetical protein
MRRFIWVFLVCTAWSESALPPVRAVLLESEGQPATEAELKGYIDVVVCKVEYDPWAKDLKDNPKPQISLYLDGRLMQGLEKVVPTTMPIVDPADSTVNQATKDLQSECEKKSGAAVAAAVADEKIKADAEAKTKAAADKAAAGNDVVEKTRTQAEAARAVADAIVARGNTATAKEEAKRRYQFRYYLDPSPKDAKDLWVRLLERPWEDRRLTVSAGLASGPAWNSDFDVKFERLNWKWLLGWMAIFVCAITLFIIYARNSDIIRDAGTLPTADAGKMKAYSLGRAQMALWTFLVGGALSFIFLVTWNENTINSGVLTLMGLSFGTTLLAATADASKAEQPRPTNGFIADLLFDGDGPSVHRYQMVLFTAILAIIFVAKAGTGLVMPEFDASLLGLMGISSGTYVGFKLIGK